MKNSQDVIECRDFISSVVPETILEDALAWIRSNMTPEQVFDKDELRLWARNNEPPGK